MLRWDVKCSIAVGHIRCSSWVKLMFSIFGDERLKRQQQIVAKIDPSVDYRPRKAT